MNCKRKGLFLLLFFLLTLPSISFAQSSQAFSLEEVGLEISIPSGYTVFTRNLEANASELGFTRLTKEELYDYMAESHIYLDAISNDGTHDIVVSLVDYQINDYDDYNLHSDTWMNGFASKIKSGGAENGLNWSEPTIYQHAQAKFLIMGFNQQSNGNTVYGLQYNTIYYDKVISITMHSYSDELSSMDMQTMKSIVDSIRFFKDPQVLEPEKEITAAFKYYDTGASISFIIPENWIQLDAREIQDDVNAVFTSTEDDRQIIMYRTFDLWGSLSESEKQGISRQDIDDSCNNIEFYSQILNIPISTIEAITYGDHEYFIYSTVSTETSAEIPKGITIISAIRYSNGYLCEFRYYGNDESPYYSSFESVLSSATFLAEDTIDKARPDEDIENTNDLGSIFAEIFIFAITTVALYSVPLIIYRYIVIKAPIERKTARKIIITYGVIALVTMSIVVYAINGNKVNVISVLLWSIINYKILTRGQKNDTSKSTDSSQ